MDARYADDYYYVNNGYYGSAAPELVPEEAPQVEVLPRERTRAKTATKTQTRPYVSLLSVVGWFVVAALGMAVLMSFVEMNGISEEIYELNERITTLKKENTELTIAYESTFKLEEIEEYAENILGMEKESNGQVKYLDSQYEDHAIIVGDGTEGSIINRLKHILKGVTEYF